MPKANLRLLLNMEPIYFISLCCFQKSKNGEIQHDLKGYAKTPRLKKELDRLEIIYKTM